MATLQRRKKSWRAQVRRKGEALSATFDTRAEAEAWAIATEAKIIAGNSAESIVQEPVTPVAGKPAKDVFTRYAKEVSPAKRGCRWEQIRIKMLIRRSRLFDRPITAITGPDMAEWRDKRLCKVSPSTMNRELCLISSMFTHAMKEWRVGLTSNPCAQITKPRKPRPRTQRITVADRKAIIAKLGWDGKSEPTMSAQWVAFAFYLALETAMRKGEILSLRWSDIDFDARHAHLDMTKNGEERDVPLSKVAMALLQIVKKRQPTAPVVSLSRRGTSTSCFGRQSARLARPTFTFMTAVARRPRQWPRNSPTSWSWQQSQGTSPFRCFKSTTSRERPISLSGWMHRHRMPVGGAMATLFGPPDRAALQVLKL
ncbi:tyrosine-type recombinase/integrase [Novosphingobium sp. SG707]|uniref:tyrosine-type recombinase/integrase n=1 Tax=Novosphingobium sp. SG707 TaxID=2586996 RepID=UPI001831A4B4|nr:tyrosine-type recombinase/integrase [Novosphingobium sp. SG707]NKJ00942.1 integrase [Novosphingobium sp. SG707]